MNNPAQHLNEVLLEAQKRLQILLGTNVDLVVTMLVPSPQGVGVATMGTAPLNPQLIGLISQSMAQAVYMAGAASAPPPQPELVQ